MVPQAAVMENEPGFFSVPHGVEDPHMVTFYQFSDDFNLHGKTGALKASVLICS